MIRHTAREVIISYMLVLPALLLVTVLLLYPMFDNVYISFFKSSGLGKSVFIGLKNYIRAFQDTNFILSFTNTLIWVVFTLAVPVIGSLIIAVFLKNMRGSTFYKFIFFLPLTLSFVSTGIIWMNVFSSNNGVLNTILELFTNGRKVKISWLASVPMNTVSMLVGLDMAAAWNFHGTIFNGINHNPQRSFRGFYYRWSQQMADIYICHISYAEADNYCCHYTGPGQFIQNI